MMALNFLPAAKPPDSHQKVRRSSFYAALRILPAGQRAAMYEIYGFCRDVDDIADDDGPRPERRAALEQWRTDILELYQGAAGGRAQSLAGPVSQFGLRREDFLAVIDGMEMDVAEAIRAPGLATLDLYCDRVASAVGRLSVRVFGIAEAEGVALSHHLGRALQLTNILRDIDEDAAIGRLYLPREALQAAGIASQDPMEVIGHGNIGQACAVLVKKAQEHFAQANSVMANLPRRQIRTPLLMSEAYGSILAALIRRGFNPPRRPVRIGKMRMLWLLLRHGFA